MANTKPLDDAAAFLDRFKEEFGLEFLARVSQKTPVAPREFENSGKLRDSWIIAVEDNQFTVTNTATSERTGQQYWQYLEYGTIHIPAVGMLRTTVQEADEIAKLARKRAKQ